MDVGTCPHQVLEATLGNIHKGYPIFWAIFGDTYLPMSDLVQFPETYLIKDVRFWQIKIPTPLTTPLKPNSGFLDQNSNHINNQDSKEIIYLNRKNSFIFLSRQNGILVFSFWFLKKWMSFFQKHTLL